MHIANICICLKADISNKLLKQTSKYKFFIINISFLGQKSNQLNKLSIRI